MTPATRAKDPPPSVAAEEAVSGIAKEALVDPLAEVAARQLDRLGDGGGQRPPGNGNGIQHSNVAMAPIAEGAPGSGQLTARSGTERSASATHFTRPEEQPAVLSDLNDIDSDGGEEQKQEESARVLPVAADAPRPAASASLPRPQSPGSPATAQVANGSAAAAAGGVQPRRLLSLRSRRQQLPVYTPEEVAQHNTEESLWLSVRGYVYDVTPVLERHPGGRMALLRHAGQDATTDFDFHSRAAQRRWKQNYLVGKLSSNKGVCSIM